MRACALPMLPTPISPSLSSAGSMRTYLASARGGRQFARQSGRVSDRYGARRVVLSAAPAFWQDIWLMSRLASIGFRTLLALALLGSAIPASAQEAISEEAKLYFANGVELLQDQPPNYTDAYYQF